MATMTSGVALAEPTQPIPRRLTKLRVEAIDSYQCFLDLEPVWNTLVSRAPLEHPFLEHVWLRTWWECFGEGSRIHILLVKEGDEAVAIAPLILTPVRMCGVKLTRLGFFYNAHVPRAEFIVASGSDEAYAAIWNHLMTDSRWDVLQLCQLAEGSGTLGGITALAASADRRVETWMSGECPYVPVRASSDHPSWEEYFAALPAKHRANLRNRTKRLGGRGPAEMETIGSEEGLKEALADGLRLEAAAWKGDAGTAISCEPALARFYSLLAQRAAERGWLRLNFLKSGVERIAFDYSLSYQGRVFLLKHGYDPAHSQLSPSNLLLQCALHSAFEQGLEEYEILGDSTEWKRCWAKDAKRHYWLYVFANNWKARFAHAAKFRMAPVLKQRFAAAPWAAKLLRRVA
jgi:CelD/BcsL family acetyltransferase involved in cellulose biosynthesis